MGSEWLVISGRDLEGERVSGGWIRAYCHIHGGDNQRSLSINNDTGFGRCHNCGAQVLVREINPDAAEHIERGQARIADGAIRVVDPKYIARAARKPPNPHTVATWQQEELTLLRDLLGNMQGRIADDRASAYIAGRGLSLGTALVLGVGYIPDVQMSGKYARIARWADHIIFPAQSPTSGVQFAGRSLKYWEPGMDEIQHKDILKAHNVDRWLKTHAVGWFNYQVLESSSHIVLCEGPFDALALIEAGVSHAIAVIGTSLSVDWIPPTIEHITLAFDGDKSGTEKSLTARHDFYERGYDVAICHAPQDGQGKDWSERYRLHGREGLAPLVVPSLDTCSCGTSVFADEGSGHYSDDGQYTCSQHSQQSQSCDIGTASFATQEELAAHAVGLVESVFVPCQVKVFRTGVFTLTQHVEMLEREARARYWRRAS